jgi:hypothetical protein
MPRLLFQPTMTSSVLLLTVAGSRIWLKVRMIGCEVLVTPVVALLLMLAPVS